MQNDNVRSHKRYVRISLKTFKKYIAALATHVERNIFIALSNCLSVVFDAQNTPEAQYVAVFVAYPYGIPNDIALLV